MSQRLKVLISAYACEPNKGSEPEVGWQWALQMARFHDVTVLTRSNNRPVIEEELRSLCGKRPLPTFVYHDEGTWLLKFKKRFKTVILYYILWQKSARDVIASLHAERRFDLIHHVTFAGFRYRTAVWQHQAPCIWGPIGGIESIPWSLLPWGHFRSLVFELSRNASNLLLATPFHALPKRARESTLVLVTTHEMKQTFADFGFPTGLMPTIGLNVNQINVRPRNLSKGPLKLLFVGNIITLKGVDLALHALKESRTDATLTLVGDGAFMPDAQALVRKLGLESRVCFRGRLPRPETLDTYPDYDLFLFPSLHDTGGYAVIEAMLHRLPVICLDCGGPSIAVQSGCGIKVPLGNRKNVIAGLAEAIRSYNQNRGLLDEHGRAAREVILRDYDWDKKGDQMNEFYQAVAASTNVPNKATGDWVFDSRSGNGQNRFGQIKRLATTVGLLFIVGALGFISLTYLKRHATLIVNDTLPGLSYAGAANANLAEGFNRTALMLMTENPDERARYRNEIEEFNQATAQYLHEYGKSIYKGERDRDLFDRLLARRSQYLDLRKQLLELIDHGKKQEAITLWTTALRSAYKQYKEAGEALLEYNMRLGQARGESIMRYCLLTQYLVAAIGISLFVVGFIAGLFK